MPKREDLSSILIIGAGPIVIGQACEFDYSGAQACKALREEGYRVILVNSNPATIMTDPEMADATYIEPIHWRNVANIIEKERPQAILPTMGGQTALNCALDLTREGVLQKFNVELIGASKESIDKAEDRQQFDQVIKSIGLETPRSAIAHSLEEARQVQAALGFPCVIRPSFTLGGSGGGVAYNQEDFETICSRGLELSPTKELLIDESLLGWKEFEMEVIRDKEDNCIIVCSIENLDPMGVHTGDSITVAPAQTLTDKEYQLMRNASLKVLRAIGVETGGSNVQFAVDPDTGRLVVIEMNPRVSRSSALASKATGFPIAKVAAKLAIGYTLDEISNDITGGVTPASFEPTIDYIVTKIPRFTFEKFPQAEDVLTTQMKSVGEVMSIVRTFSESLQKALRSLEIGISGLTPIIDIEEEDLEATLSRELRVPSSDRIRYIGDAFRADFPLEKIRSLTGIDAWFLDQIRNLIQIEESIKGTTLKEMDKNAMVSLKKNGFSDSRIAALLECPESQIRDYRQKNGIFPVYKRVDTCAAEFTSTTAYMYSTYEAECEAKPTDKPKIIILGGGPNRIGQGIEFDYCCVHASLAIKSEKYEAIMINCNPETVSTDYDTSDRLYFEPLTFEDVMSVIELEKPKGVIVQFGGQTPLKLANELEAAGVPIIGTSPDAIDEAEDRKRFQQLIKKLDLKQPANETVQTKGEAFAVAEKLGFPLVARPSYVLGGRAMEIVYDQLELKSYIDRVAAFVGDSPVLLDRFLDHAIEVDIDAVSDGQDVVIGSVMQHIEQAGIHSGDSACSLPPYSLPEKLLDRMRDQVARMAKHLKVCGLMNVQLAVQGEEVFVLEVNPRASRTVPFVSKCIGTSLAKIAAKCMIGISLKEQKFTQEIVPDFYSVKEAVFPFGKFPGVDPILGPEMKSTGEVMGIGINFGEAYGKAQMAANEPIPSEGNAFLSVRDADKSDLIEIAKILTELGFSIVATRGTKKTLETSGISVKLVNKVQEGRPHIVDMLKNQEINFIVNTTEGKQAIADSFQIRRTALQNKVCYTTTIAGGKACVEALKHGEDITVRSLQSLQRPSY
ncbi:MAG: carbamoyl phosphate synthase large subunit [Gammaproteobacteria bacterium]|nr:carbamoyl phosphate synthase large subunit [Gammaproteobacteria bacterium]